LEESTSVQVRFPYCLTRRAMIPRSPASEHASKQGTSFFVCTISSHLLYILCISLFQSTLIVTYSLFLLLVNAEQLTRPSLAKIKEQPGIDHSYERSFCLCLVVLHGTTRKAWHPNSLDSLGIGRIHFPSVDTGRRNIEVGKHLLFCFPEGY
jgi:hypothetical protein